MCVTVPVFHAGEVVAFVQAFGHHDDIGGACPGSMPSGARSVLRRVMVPPIRLWDQGKPTSRAADHDAQLAHARLAGRRPGRGVLGLPDGRRDASAKLFDRYGRDAVDACFDAIISKTTDIPRELLAEDPGRRARVGGYAEHDGVDEPRLPRAAHHR